MKVSVSSPTHENFVLVPVPSCEFPEEALPGSEMSYAEGLFGKVVIQQITAEPFHILYNYYHITEPCVVRFTGDSPPLRLLISLKGDAHFVVNGTEDIHLEQGQFNILYSPQIDANVVFEQAHETLLFNMYLPMDCLQDFASLQFIQKFIDTAGNGKSHVMFPTAGWITSEVIREISYVLGFSERQPLREYMFSLKAKQLLHLVLLQKHYAGIEPISAVMLDSIHRARHIIEAAVGEILTVDKVAGRAGVTLHELKKYFKPVTGLSVSAFMTQARLNNARLLVAETDLPIKEIAQITGYDHEQNFITAFKKHFDYTPFYVRQLRG